MLIRRTAGSGVILIASIVLILCFAGILGVSIMRSRVDGFGDDVFGAAEDSLAFMDEKLDRIEEAFKNGHRRLELLAKGVDRLPQNETKAEVASLLKTLDEEVFESLKSAQTWLDSTHAVAVGAGKISERWCRPNTHPPTKTRWVWRWLGSFRTFPMPWSKS